MKRRTLLKGLVLLPILATVKPVKLIEALAAPAEVLPYELEGCLVTIVGGPGLGQTRMITYDEANDVYNTIVPWDIPPDNNSEFKFTGLSTESKANLTLQRS